MEWGLWEGMGVVGAMEEGCVNGVMNEQVLGVRARRDIGLRGGKRSFMNRGVSKLF